MATSKNPNANPLFREAIKSQDACVELFRRDQGGHLAVAVEDVNRQLKQLGKSTSMGMAQAELACGDALWDAITQFNILRRDRGVLGGLPVPDYEVLAAEDALPTSDYEIDPDEFDAGAWIYGFETDENDEDGDRVEGEESILAEGPDRKSTFALAARLRRSRTQWGKIETLAKEARSIAEKIEEFAQGYDYVHRTGVLARAAEGYETADDAERPKLRTELMLQIARLRSDEGIGGIHAMLTKLATFRDAGGNPGHLFQRSFLLALIPHWVAWTGEKPRRENRAFIEFVQAAYFVVSARKFEGWENLMTTALQQYEKTSQQKP